MQFPTGIVNDETDSSWWCVRLAIIIQLSEEPLISIRTNNDRSLTVKQNTGSADVTRDILAGMCARAREREAGQGEQTPPAMLRHP